MALAMIHSLVPSMTVPTMNGKAFAQTMPGVSSPFGFFDPLNLCPEAKEEVLMFREAELNHGRVSMMAALGYVVQEAFHPIFGDVSGPVIRQLDQVLTTSNGQGVGSVLLMAIFFSEIYRARTGWVEPEIEYRTLREGYEPGSLGFDPMGLMPTTDAELFAMKTKELNNGRLAMIGVAGMTAQEIVSNTAIIGN